MNISIKALDEQVISRCETRTKSRTKHEHQVKNHVHAYEKKPTRVHAVQPTKIKKKHHDNIELVQWFLHATDLPKEPFKLNQAITVIDPGKFYESLRTEIELGDRSPRARFGALQNDLQALKQIYQSFKHGRTT